MALWLLTTALGNAMVVVLTGFNNLFVFKKNYFFFKIS